MGRFWKWWTASQERYNKICEEAATKVDNCIVKGTLEWAEAECKKLNDEAEVRFQERAAAWRRFDVACYNPNVFVRDYAAGKFLIFDDVSAPIQHIVSIDVTNMGNPPTKEHWYAKREYHSYHSTAPVKYAPERLGFNNESRGTITISMVSGVKYRIYCHTYALDILLERLKQAWKHGA